MVSFYSNDSVKEKREVGGEMGITLISILQMHKKKKKLFSQGHSVSGQVVLASGSQPSTCYSESSYSSNPEC